VFELKDSDGFAADDDDGREWDFFPANAENRADAEGAGAKPRTCVRLRSAVVAVGHSILVTVPFSALVEAARGGEGGGRRRDQTGGDGSDECGSDEGGSDDASRRRRSRSKQTTCRARGAC
jgi:hypothetical protein